MKHKKIIDAYGQELWDLYKGNIKLEIIERDDGLVEAGTYGQMYLAGYKDWPRLEQRAIKFARGRVLDIGCGAGRHAIYLQRQGLAALGIDQSSLAVKISRLRGLKKARVLPIEKINTFPRNSFDTILMLGNNFGLFGGFKKAKALLRQMYKITSDHGIIIAETRDPYQTKRQDYLAYHALNRRRGRLPGQLRLRIRHRTTIGGWFDYLMVSKKEMHDILENTGWRVRRFMDSKDSQYVAILEKVI